MKFLTLFSIPFVVILSVFVWPSPSSKQTAGAGVVELTDQQGVVFARNLTDWRNRPVDSIQMDIYYPTGATSDKKYPVVLFCHAGGFSGGNRFNVMAICDRYAEQGFIAVGFDYRVGYIKGKGDQSCETDSITLNQATYRACQDANAAWRFLVANANSLRVDTSALFIAGSSAGAALALQDAYLNDSTAQIFYPYIPPVLGGLQTSGNNYTNTYKIKGIVSMWGALAYADGLINQNFTSIPTILFKGTEEGGIPDSVGHYKGCPTLPILFSAPAIYARLQTQNTPVVFHRLPDANHPAYDVEFCVEQSACYMRAIMAGTAHTARYEYYEPSCQ